jgi:hypothetical protein
MHTSKQILVNHNISLLIILLAVGCCGDGSSQKTAWHMQVRSWMDGWIWCCLVHKSKSITINNASNFFSRIDGWLLCLFFTYSNRCLSPQQLANHIVVSCLYAKQLFDPSSTVDRNLQILWLIWLMIVWLFELEWSKITWGQWDVQEIKHKR